MRLAVCVLMLATRTAAATGVCENTPRHYDPPRLYSETEDAFAVFASQDWYDEVERGGTLDEVRGKVHFVELRDTKGTVLAILSSARGKDAQRVTDLVGAFDPVPPAKLAGTLKTRGYLPLTSTGKKLMKQGPQAVATDLEPRERWQGRNVVAPEASLVPKRGGELPGQSPRTSAQLALIDPLEAEFPRVAVDHYQEEVGRATAARALPLDILFEIDGDHTILYV